MPRHDQSGRTGGQKAPRHKNLITKPFAWRSIEMIESPAMAVLSLSARRVLDRLEVELHRHGGNDNGKLPCTYDDFEAFGIHRHSIGPAIREAVALGFVEITEKGRAGNSEFRKPSMYRLTYRHTLHANPTDDWQGIESVEEADFLARSARTSVRPSVRRRLSRAA